ncbi:MAG: hypothetical protein HQL42_05005 [Alphaproteobacteria bacterium]|nr:hypothetical protein [Alphaproteobacteria bacterium]
MTALLESLPPAELTSLILAGEEVARLEQALRAAGDDPAGLLTGGGRVAPFRHYPEGDVYDFATHSQFYYHIHRGNEYGHIHLFLRPKGMPPEIRPLVGIEGEPDAPCHLIAVGFGPDGSAAELFTTNRWVTGEAWYSAESVARMLPYFSVTGGRHARVGAWLTALVALFRPIIVALACERDAEIERWRQAHPGADALDDAALEVTSRRQISVSAWRADLQNALER